MTITTAELVERSGATKRQIDSWCDYGILQQNVKYLKQAPRMFDESMIEKAAFLVRVSAALRELTLKTLADNFEEGELYIGDNIQLSWW